MKIIRNYKEGYNSVIILKYLLLLFYFFTLHSCYGGNRKLKIEQDNEKNIQTYKEFSEKKFLKDQEGTWICYKYIRDSTHSVDIYDENYAKEFLKHSYFTIYGDTLSGVDIYNTPIYAYKYPVKFKEYDDESVFIVQFKPQEDSLIFIMPYNPYEYYWENGVDLPYYNEAPLNTIKMYYNDDFITYNRGYFFFFKKGIKSKDSGYGVPGDDRNYFKVTMDFEDISMEDMCNKFISDYPYGGSQLLNNKYKNLLFKNNWISNPIFRVEKTQANGKFVLEITKQESVIKLNYYLSDDGN